MEKEPNTDKQEDNLEQMDPAIRPGGVFMVQLLMEQPCPLPSVAQIKQVLSRRVGRLDLIGEEESQVASFAALDHVVQFRDSQGPMTLSILGCGPFDGQKIDQMRRSQMWDCQQHRDRILSECRYGVMACDMLGGGLPAQERANLLMDYVEGLVELYPSCRAVYFVNSGKLILAEDIRQTQVQGLDRFIRFAVNVRFFNIQGGEDKLVDTLGLSTLYIEDLQYHFHTMDPNWVVGHAYNMASYILHNDRPIQSGDTIDGIREGQLAQDIQWPCHFEQSLAQPFRPVLDVCMGQFAAGQRENS